MRDDSVLSRLNSSVIRRGFQDDALRIVLSCIDKDTWKYLASIVNNSFNATLGEGTVSDSSVRFYKATNTNELLRWYGAVMTLENIYGNSTKSITNNLSSIAFPTQRFHKIMTALAPKTTDFKIIYNRLRFAWKSNWVPGNYVAIDEAIYAYQPCKKTKKKWEIKLRDPIPVVYIPRKPHKNGLLCYKMCTRSQKTGLPYQLDLEPFDQFPQITARDALKRMVSRWSYTHKPIYVADAAFGSIDTLEYINDKEAHAVLCTSIGSMGYMYRLLRRGTDLNNWNGAMNSDGFIASVRTTIKSNNADDHSFEYDEEGQVRNSSFKSHFVLTNLYKGKRWKQVIPESKGPVYSTEWCMKQTSKVLKEELTKHGLRANGTKSDMTRKLIACCNTQKSQRNMILERLEANNFKSDAKPHDVYRRHFNSVDLHDARWYDFHYQYALNNWRSKMMLSILTDAITNSWVIMNEMVKTDHCQFRSIVAKKLLKADLSRYEN